MKKILLGSFRFLRVHFRLALTALFFAICVLSVTHLVDIPRSNISGILSLHAVTLTGAITKTSVSKLFSVQPWENKKAQEIKSEMPASTEQAEKLKVLFGHTRLPASKQIAKTFPGGLSLVINSDTVPPVTSGKTITLTAQITSEEVIPDLTLKWILPHQVKVKSGSLVEMLSTKTGESSTRSLTVIIPDQANYQIIAEVAHIRQPDGEKQGMTAQFNSNPDALPAIHRTALFDEFGQRLRQQGAGKFVNPPNSKKIGQSQTRILQ